jgi:diacylglycerol kinase (ATP)
VLVANCGELIPGILPIHASVQPDDGMFDVAVFDAVTFGDALRLAWRLFRRRPQADPGIRFLRASRVAIATEPPLPVQADGEAAGTTPMTVELLPRALHVLAPRRA